MSIITVSSLKGGVGKTSLAVNLAHAFSTRGCRVLLIDLDPSAHATRHFQEQGTLELPKCELAYVIANADPKMNWRESRIDFARNVRREMYLITGGNELRYFLWGRGGKAFSQHFSSLLRRCRQDYDMVILDTPPDFNVLTRTALSCSDIALVPVDASEMSLASLEELLRSSQHFERPTWAIVRTMQNRSAKRSKAFTEEFLKEHRLATADIPAEAEEESAEEFLSLLQEWGGNRNGTSDQEGKSEEKKNGRIAATSMRPTYLLRTIVHRTEAQNQLSFERLTAFDRKKTNTLAEEYRQVARELESLESMLETEPAGTDLGAIFDPSSYSNDEEDADESGVEAFQH